MTMETKSSTTKPKEFLGKEYSNDAVVDGTQGEVVILAHNIIDPALEAKMSLVNHAIDQIGFTPYHLKLFFLNGFGYAADSLLAFLPIIAAGNVIAEFGARYRRAGQLSLYIGLLIGALFWGITADVIGRKWAFNLSLLICSMFSIIAGASPNFESWCFFNAMLAFGAGGNLVLDTTVFLEYLPHGKSWLITLMATWWGVGQTLAGLYAWTFLPNFSCPSTAVTCTRSENWGWRYLYFISGGTVLIMSLLRWTVIRFHETPKFSLCQNDDDHVVNTLRGIAEKYNRPFCLAADQLRNCGEVSTSHAKKKASISELIIHYRGLFESREQGTATALIWLSWALVGIGYSLFYIFLLEYLASRGANFGTPSAYTTWRDYVITNTLAIPGPIVAGYMCKTRLLGRRYTMTIGALLSMAFLFAYTTVRNAAQNLGFSCAISIVINVYYGTLYAYTPEALPSAHRATGSGTAVALNRLMGVVSVIVASFASTASSIPIYLCAALFGGLAVLSVLLPFEPAQRQRN